MHREDGGPWMHWKITGHVTDNHNGRSYRVRVTNIGRVTTRMKRQIKPTNITAEDYLQNEMAKGNQTLAADGLNKLADHFMQLHKSDYQYRNRRKKTM